MGHLAAFALVCVEVDLHEHVDVAGQGGFGDGRVGADDHLAGYGVAEADHHVLACRQAEGLGVVLEFEAEDTRVPGDSGLGVERGSFPVARLQEDC